MYPSHQSLIVNELMLTKVDQTIFCSYSIQTFMKRITIKCSRYYRYVEGKGLMYEKRVTKPKSFNWEAQYKSDSKFYFLF